MVHDSFYDGMPSSFIPDLTNIVVGIDDRRIRLDKVIGQGTWGVVYRAHAVHEPKLEYAVKCVSSRNMKPRQRRALDYEIYLHGVCAEKSEHVLRLDRVYEDKASGMIFIVTELCDGDLLGDIHHTAYVGNDEFIRDTFLQVLDGVEVLHGIGVYHRDLKPENILLKDGRFIIADFGFATKKETSRDFHMGSGPYMSPEVLGGIDVKLSRYSSLDADMWALGVILTMLITGNRPWRRASMADERFSLYVTRDRDMLLKGFPISKDANEILKMIFTVEPGQERITIGELRDCVKNVDSFYNPKWLANFRKEQDAKEHVTSSNDSHSVDRSISDSAAVKPVEPISSPERVSASMPAEPASVIEGDITDGSNPDDSDADSEGPITPETHAVDAVGLFDSENLDGMAELDIADAYVPSKSPVPKALSSLV